MAQHQPIPTTDKHIKMLSMFPDIQKRQHFKQYVVDGGYMFRLPLDYEMNEYHGLVDAEIVAFTPDSKVETHEIHLDSSGKINQVYLVI